MQILPIPSNLYPNEQEQLFFINCINPFTILILNTSHRMYRLINADSYVLMFFHPFLFSFPMLSNRLTSWSAFRHPTWYEISSLESNNGYHPCPTSYSSDSSISKSSVMIAL